MVMDIKHTVYGIVIGVISSLIASGIVYAATEILLWNVRVPLWIWLLGSVIVLCVVQIVICLKQYFHIKNVIAEYTEGYFKR